MKRLLLLVLVALGGCASNPEARVPIGVPCRVDMPARPAWATRSMPSDADIFVQVKTLLAERKQRIGYESLLEAAIEGCNTLSPATGNALSR